VAFPELPGRVLDGPDVILHILYPPELTVTVNSRRDGKVAVVDCTPVLAGWKLTFPKQPGWWSVPDCVNIGVTVQGPDGQEFQSSKPDGVVELRPDTRSGEIAINVKSDVNGASLFDQRRIVELDRTRPIRISGLRRLLIGRSSTLTVTIPCNAPAAGIPLSITTDPNGRVIHPDQVTLVSNLISATIDIAARDAAPEGNVILRASDPSGEHEDGEFTITVQKPATGLALSRGGAELRAAGRNLRLSPTP